MTTGEVMAEVLQDRVFFDESGGGVTFSGGEPLLQHEFLFSLLSACRREGLHTTVDTAGCVSPSVLEQIAPLVDLFLYDLKMMDEKKHREFTGASNRLSLENLKRLERWGRQLVLRIPLIPGVNDDQENLHSSGRLIASLRGVREVHLLPYHASGAAKYSRLGKAYALSSMSPPDHTAVTRALAELQKFVPSVTVGG